MANPTMTYSGSGMTIKIREKNEKQDKLNKYAGDELKSYIRRQKEIRRLREMQEFEERERLLESKKQRLKELDMKCKQIATKKQEKKVETRVSYQASSSSQRNSERNPNFVNGNSAQNGTSRKDRESLEEQAGGFDKIPNLTVKRRSSSKGLVDAKQSKSACKLEREAAHFIFKEFENIVRRECKNLLRTRSAQLHSRSASSSSIQSEVKENDDADGRRRISRSKPENTRKEDKNVGTSFIVYDYIDSRSENDIETHHKSSRNGYHEGRSASYISIYNDGRSAQYGRGYDKLIPRPSDQDLSPYFTTHFRHLNKISERTKNEAAAKIQAAYKSYRVRKVLSEAKLRPGRSRTKGYANHARDLASGTNAPFTSPQGPGKQFVESSRKKLLRGVDMVGKEKVKLQNNSPPQRPEKPYDERIRTKISKSSAKSNAPDAVTQSSTPLKTNVEGIPGYIPPPPEIGLISRPTSASPRMLPFLRFKQVDEPFPKHIEGRLEGMQRSDPIQSTQSPLKLISSISKFQLPYSLKSCSKDGKSSRLEEQNVRAHMSSRISSEPSPSAPRTPMQSQAQAFKETLIQLRSVREKTGGSPQRGATNAKQLSKSRNPILDLPDPAFSMVLQEKLRLMKEKIDPLPASLFAPPTVLTVPSPVRKSQMTAVSKATEQIKRKIIEAKHILEEYKNELLRCNNNTSVMSQRDDQTYESDFDTDIPSQSVSVSQQLTGTNLESDATSRGQEIAATSKTFKVVSPRKPQVAVRPTTSQSSLETIQSNAQNPSVLRKKSPTSEPVSTSASFTKLSKMKDSRRSVMTTPNSRHSPQGPQDFRTQTARSLSDAVKTSQRRGIIECIPSGQILPVSANETSHVSKVESVNAPVGRRESRDKSPVSTIDRTEDGVEDVEEDAEESLSQSSKDMEDESETDYEEIPPTASRGSLNPATEDINYDTDFDSDIQSLSLSKPNLSTATQKGEPVSSIVEDDEEVKEDFEGEYEQASSRVDYDTTKPVAVQHLSSIEENVSKRTSDQSSQAVPEEISEYVSEALPKSVQSTSIQVDSADKIVQSDMVDSNQIVDEHVSYDTEFDTDIPSLSKKEPQPLELSKNSLRESVSISLEVEDSVQESTIKEEIDDLSVEQSIAYEVSESPKPIVTKIVKELLPKPMASNAHQPARTDPPKSEPLKAVTMEKPAKVGKPIDLNLSNASDSSAVSDISTPKDIDDILEQILAEDSSDMEEMGDKVLDSGTSEDKYTLETEKPRDSAQDGMDISPQVDIAQLDGVDSKMMMSPFLETHPPVISSVSEVTEPDDDWTGKQSTMEMTTGKTMADPVGSFQKPELEGQRLFSVTGGGDQDESSDDDDYVEDFLSLKTVPKIQKVLPSSVVSEAPSKDSENLDNAENSKLEIALTTPDVTTEPRMKIESSLGVEPIHEVCLNEPGEEISQKSQISSSESSQILEAQPSGTCEESRTSQSMPAKNLDAKEILEIAKSVDANIVEKIESLIVEEISKQIEPEHEESDCSQGTGVDDSKYSLNSRASNFYVEEVVYESDFDTEVHSERSEASKNKSNSASISSSKHQARSKLENVVKVEVQRFVEGERVLVDQEINEKIEKNEEESLKRSSSLIHDVKKSPAATLESRLVNVIEKKEMMDILVTRILKRVFKDVVTDDKQATQDVEEIKSRFAGSIISEIECLSPIPKPSSDDEMEDSIQEEIDGDGEWFEDELIAPNQDAEEESLKLEAAKIIAEQLRIEKEIRALEALQAQVPANLLNLAEVPDKPPPPYSPPSSESVSFTSRSCGIQCTPNELEDKITLIVNSVWESWRSTGTFAVLEEFEPMDGKIDATQPGQPCGGDSSQVMEDTTEKRNQVNSSTERTNSNNQLSPSTLSSRAFNTLLHDLIVDTIKEVLLIENVDCLSAKPYVDRVRPGSLSLEAAKLRIPRTKETLIQTTFNRIANLLPYPVLASYVPTSRKRLTKWTSRPRDPVDEVLAEELIAEDREWTESWPEEILVLDRWTEKFSKRALHEVMLACKTVFS